MKTTPLQLTLRRMRDALTSPKVLGGMAIVVVVLGVSGPFQTYEAFSLPARLGFWLVVCSLTFTAGFFAGDLTEEALKPRLGEWPRFIAGSLATALVVILVVFLINTYSFGSDPMSLSAALSIAAYVAIISFAVSVSFKLFGPKPEDAKPAARILERVPLHLRGALISLTVQDHYTEVRTSKGTHLVLIRLSDAMAEAGEGLQIHRSHWVARRAIAKVERQSGKVVLSTVDGTVLPVSRSFLPEVKAAGLLP